MTCIDISFLGALLPSWVKRVAGFPVELPSPPEHLPTIYELVQSAVRTVDGEDQAHKAINQTPPVPPTLEKLAAGKQMKGKPPLLLSALLCLGVLI